MALLVVKQKCMMYVIRVGLWRIDDSAGWKGIAHPPQMHLFKKAMSFIFPFLLDNKRHFSLTL